MDGDGGDSGKDDLTCVRSDEIMRVISLCDL